MEDSFHIRRENVEVELQIILDPSYSTVRSRMSSLVRKYQLSCATVTLCMMLTCHLERARALPASEPF